MTEELPEEGRSKKIIRQFKRYLGDKDAELVINDAVQSLKDGKAGSLDEKSVAVLSNFSEFINAIENAYAELEDRNRIANRNIEISSKELTTALHEVETLNLNINAMLDSLGQALLFFDRDGVCAPFYSKACLKILGGDPTGKQVTNVLGFSNEKKQTFESWLDVVFSGQSAMDFDDLKKLLPSEIINDNNVYIELNYRPIYLYGDNLTGVLLIATDVTKEREAQLKMEALQLAAKKTQAVSQNRNEFHELISDLYGFVNFMKDSASGEVSGEDLLTLKRALHTFKGQAGMFALTDLTNLLHALEDDIRYQYSKAVPSENIMKQAELLKNQVDKEKKFAQNIFGDHFMSQGNTKIVDHETALQLEALVNGIQGDEDSKNALKSFIFENFMSVPIHNLFQGFQREIMRICELKGKPIPDINITGDNLAVVPEHYGDFFKTITHLARNIGEHALEMATDRKELGKKTSGQVDVHIEKHDKQLKIKISDDGSGIDAERIRSLLRKKGMEDAAQKTDADVIYHILDSDFSTASATSITSGRGIGMNAIYQAVKSLNGKVEIVSDFANAKGTTFVFTLPNS